MGVRDHYRETGRILDVSWLLRLPLTDPADVRMRGGQRNAFKYQLTVIWDIKGARPTRPLSPIWHRSFFCCSFYYLDICIFLLICANLLKSCRIFYPILNPLTNEISASTEFYVILTCQCLLMRK